MRYLKKYKIPTYTIEELEEFCNENLSYLLDSDFNLRVESYGSRNSIFLKSQRSITSNLDVGLNWLDIKDDFIPFIEILNEKYKILHDIEFDTIGDKLGHLWFDTELIIDDLIDINFQSLEILQIKINLEK